MISAVGERTVRATTEGSMGDDSGVITHPRLRMRLRREPLD